MRAIPVCFPVVVETSATSRRAPVLTGVLGELVSVGPPTMNESGRHRTVVRVMARDESTARRRASAAVPHGRIVEVGEPTPLQHYASQKALPYRRSFVYGRTKNARFNVQGGASGHAKATPPVHPTGAAPAAGVGMGESVDALLGPAPMLEATPQQRKAREKRRKQWRSAHPALARKLAMNAKRTAARRATKAKGKRKQSLRKANKYRDRFDPNYESMTEEFKPVGRAQQALWAAMVQRSKADMEYGIKMGERSYALNDFARGREFRGIHFGAIQSAAEAMAKKGAIVYDGTTTVRMKRMGESLVTFAEIDARAAKVKAKQASPIDKAISGYAMATQAHENLKGIPESWFQSERGRATVVRIVDKVRMEEGDEPADALEDAYLHRKHVVSSLEEQPVEPESADHTIRVRFESRRARDFATANIMRFMEACSCTDDDPQEETEATFTVCGACSAASAARKVTENLVKLNLSRHEIVENFAAIRSTQTGGKAARGKGGAMWTNYDSEDPTHECPACGEEGELLGRLGSLDHYRCPACGLQFNARHAK